MNNEIMPESAPASRLRVAEQWALLVVFLVFTGCNWNQKSPALISEGTIVLLRSGDTNAAFVVTKQDSGPGRVDYTWFLRRDGKSTFDTKDPACVTGDISNANSIAFGPFDIEWSTAGSAGGWVYYPSRYRWMKMPWGKYIAYSKIPGPVMAVITERDLAKVDAEDPRWKYHR